MDNLMDTLSTRELEILRLVATGMSNTEIGERLQLSQNTVRAHLYSTYNKLGAVSRAQAVRIAKPFLGLD